MSKVVSITRTKDRKLTERLKADPDPTVREVGSLVEYLDNMLESAGIVLSSEPVSFEETCRRIEAAAERAKKKNDQSV